MDDLRTIVERVRDRIHNQGLISLDDLGAIIGRLISRYLAEHPADDDTPIDEPWLRSVATETVECDKDWFLYKFISSAGGPVCGFYIEPLMGCDGCVVADLGGYVVRVPMPRTRRNVRRLASALGVTLKEGA